MNSIIDLNKKSRDAEIRKQIEKFEKHISLFDDQPDYFFAIASLKLKISDIEGALKYMNEACKLYPKDEFMYQTRADILYKLKDYNGALINLNQAIDLNPKNDSYFFRRGNVLMKLKNYSNANDDYSKAIEINNLNDAYFFNRGLVRVLLLKLGSAIADFEMTLGLNPNRSKVNDCIKNCKKLQALGDDNLYFSNMSGFGSLKCNSCNFSKDLVGSVHKLDLWECLGYQCQKCGELHKINNPNDLNHPLICKCTGHLSRGNIVFCPECKSKNVKYNLKYLI